MPRISLREFFSTGSFGAIALGSSRVALEAAFGAPDGTSSVAKKPTGPAICKYGDVEFHFEGDALWLIHIDCFTGEDFAPTGGRRLELDAWFVSDGAPLRSIVEELSVVGLASRIVVEPHFDRTLIVLSSGIELGFSGTNPAEAGLSFISRVGRSTPPTER